MVIKGDTGQQRCHARITHDTKVRKTDKIQCGAKADGVGQVLPQKPSNPTSPRPCMLPALLSGVLASERGFMCIVSACNSCRHPTRDNHNINTNQTVLDDVWDVYSGLQYCFMTIFDFNP